MVETIVAVLGALTGFGGFVFGVVKWKDAKKEREQTKRKQTTEDIIVKKIDQAIIPLRQTNAEQNERIARLEKKQDENERDRLRAEIMIAANKLHNGQKLTSADYKHIEHVYTKYHDMGGNSYIDGQMKYIREKEAEYIRSLDINQN